MFKSWKLLGLIVLLVGGLSLACVKEKEGPMEKVGREIDEAVDETKGNLEEIGDEIEDAADEVEDKLDGGGGGA